MTHGNKNNYPESNNTDSKKRKNEMMLRNLEDMHDTKNPNVE